MTVIKNASKGYGYNYASLADIANQGFTIPMMKTEVVCDCEYVFYFDKTAGWVQGARVVIPEGKGMNKAQLYGSALTYARRYTTLMALSLACGDDSIIENLNADGSKKAYEIDSNKVTELRSQMYSKENKESEEEIELSDKQLQWIVDKLGLNSISDVTHEHRVWFLKELDKSMKEKGANK